VSVRAALVPAGAILALSLALARPHGALAQDFAPASPAGPQSGAAALLERALPAAERAVSFESAATRWLGLASLETRGAALGFAAGPARFAAGLSQTGDPELGWTGAGLAVGGAGPEGGAALRVVGRRDRSEGPVGLGHLGRGAGYEAGAGAWLAAAPGLLLWASAPQLWTGGQDPPLSRPLELGARWAAHDLAAWVALVAPQRGDDGERSAGLSLGTDALAVWAEARDGPLRGSLGVRGVLGPLVAEARADAHPVLGETTRVSLAWRMRGARSAR
jgi:hypothetical protein